MERYGSGPIVVHDYDPRWPAMFAAERAHLETVLGPIVVGIEHVGSTSVPGLPAKPIIDLLVGVRSLDEARSTCIVPIESLGYLYLPSYEQWLPDELFFRKGPPGPWTHHLHVTEPASERWREDITFRDYLRAHPEVAEDYARLKRNLAKAAGDNILSYRAGKAPFVQEVLCKAGKAAISA